MTPGSKLWCETLPHVKPRVRLFREPDSISGARVVQLIRFIRQSPSVGATHERTKSQELSLLRMPKPSSLTPPPGAAANDRVSSAVPEGQVTDQSQAAIPRAAVTVISERTGLGREQLTTGDGTFAFVQRRGS